jgi:hypothetical protein
MKLGLWLWKPQDLPPYYSTEGLIITSEKELLELVEKDLYLYGTHGKHSEFIITFKMSQMTLITEDSKVIEALRPMGMVIAGFNPFDYVIDGDGEY